MRRAPPHHPAKKLGDGLRAAPDRGFPGPPDLLESGKIKGEEIKNGEFGGITELRPLFVFVPRPFLVLVAHHRNLWHFF